MSERDDVSERPNVLFLVADSLRYDVLFGTEFDTQTGAVSDGATEKTTTVSDGATEKTTTVSDGATEKTTAAFDGRTETPTLTRLAEEGTLFSQCFSQGISTAPSMTAMLTGRYPLDYGGHWYIDDSQPTMAQQFQHNGYTTGAIHSNPNVSRLRNFDRGFDTFEENILPLSTDGLLNRLPNSALRYLNKTARILSRTPYLPADEIHTQLRDWIGDTQEPWFLWTQYMDTHGPYLPGGDFSYRNKIRAERLWRKAAVNAPEEITDEEHEQLRRNYRLEVEYLDASLGRFLDRLEADGHLENTVIVFTADHGDEFREHGQYGHANLPYRELVHVPLVVRFPDSLDIETPDVIDAPVRTIDILPTVLDCIDAELTAEMRERMEGQSFAGLFSDEHVSYDAIVTEKEMRGDDTLRFGFRADGWTYLYDGKTDDELLYEQDDDPGEQTDVTPAEPDVCEQFRTRLQDRLSAIERTSEGIETPDIEDHPGVQERLEALGYKE